MLPGYESLRVALIAGTLGQGGAEKQLLYMAKSLQAAGVRVVLYSLTRGEYYEERFQRAGIAIQWVGRFSNPCARILQIARRLARFRPHVVQSAHSFTNLYAAAAAKIAGSVGIGAVRESYTSVLQNNPGWGRWLLSAPDGLIVNSQAARDAIVSSMSAPAERVHLLPNVIDLEEYGSRHGHPDPDQVRVIFVGRLIGCKRADRFLRALNIARTIEPTIEGWIVGDGPVRDELCRLAAALGLLPFGVQFLYARPDVPALLGQADMFALTSDQEGTPNTLLEAMASGLPVVSTPAGDVPALVQDGVSGYLTPFENTDLFATRLVTLARDRERRIQMGLEARRRVQQLASAGTLAERLVSIYRAAARTSRNRSLLEALNGIHLIGEGAPS